MLRLRFFNVAEGDAMLVEDITPKKTFRLLVDTGRAKMVDLPPCATCAEHLAQCGVNRIDELVITHLHADHAGGLGGVLNACRVGRLLSGYVPLTPGAACAVDAKADRHARSMAQCLNDYSQDVALAKRMGASLCEMYDSWSRVQLTEDLSVDYIVPNLNASRLQRSVFNRMLQRRNVPQEEILRAARLRNPNSLRIRLHYKNREVELSGDCYGSVWEGDDVAPCDIWKIPHHGDAKSVTKALVGKMQCRHAIICCASRYLPKKNRPSSDVIRLLRKSGAQVWFTDAYALGKIPARHAAITDFIITDYGEIVAPQSE